MLIDVPYVADLLMLRDKRQAVIDYTLRRENNRLRNFDYVVGGLVLELIKIPRKMGLQTKGPYKILQVHTNGALTKQRSAGVTDRVNVRRLRLSMSHHANEVSRKKTDKKCMSERSTIWSHGCPWWGRVHESK